MEALERRVDQAVERLRYGRHCAAEEAGGAEWARHALDVALRTDRAELLDRADVPAQRKLAIVRALHRQNRAVFSYARFLRHLEPLVREVQAREGRPARVLELASGSGEFTLALAELAERKRLPVEITGSDVVAAYVDDGNARATRRRLKVRFEVVNAFDMSALAPGAYDVAFIAQSLHHFTPGQLAMMIAQARRVAKAGFVGIDGHRSLLVLAFLGVAGPLSAAASLTPGFLHDAWVSGRKMYPMAELELIAQLATPEGRVTVREDFPGFTVLTVR